MPNAPTQTANDNSTKIATTAYADAKVTNEIAEGQTTIAPSQGVVFNALKNTERPIVNDTVSVNVAGTTASTLVKTYEFTTGTLPVSGFLDIFTYLNRVTGVSGTYSIGISVNSVNNPATATSIASLTTAGNFVQTLPLKGTFILKNGTITGASISQSTGANYPSMTSTPASITFNNVASSVWVFIFITPTGLTQSLTLQAVEITI
jgi:hypothetical protein